MLWQPTRGILQPNQHWRRGQGSAAAGGTTTFNPSDKTAGMALSGGNLVATITNISGSQNVRSIATVSAGKLYCEFTIGTRATPGNETVSMGVASATASHNIGSYIGGDNFSLGLWPRSTSASNAYYGNGGTSLGVFANGGDVGTVWGMAFNFDLAIPKIWWKDWTHGSGWNNAAIGSQDPSVPLGGFGSAALGSLPWAIAAGGESDTTVWTLNVGATAYTGTPPSGYVNWP